MKRGKTNAHHQEASDLSRGLHKMERPSSKRKREIRRAEKALSDGKIYLAVGGGALAEKVGNTYRGNFPPGRKEEGPGEGKSTS